VTIAKGLVAMVGVLFEIDAEVVTPFPRKALGIVRVDRHHTQGCKGMWGTITAPVFALPATFQIVFFNLC